MSKPSRAAFTLVEMLVVVVIIGMLMAMLLPAIIGARARARQTTCLNNQKELATAVQQYETSKKHLPGYLNKFGNNPTAVNWCMALLPYIGRQDLWRKYTTGTEWTDVTGSDLKIPHFVCPDDQMPGKTLTYVGNCGRPDDLSRLPNNPVDYPYNGVFHFLFGVTSGGNFVPVKTPLLSASELKDGASQTVLFSENLDNSGTGPAKWWYNANDSESIVGMVWNPGNAWGTGSGIWWEATPQNPYMAINQGRESGTALARPSSNHTGGVVVTFCDGHQKFLSDQIWYYTYVELMTPDTAKALAAFFGNTTYQRPTGQDPANTE